jgi:hypothetical protein
VVRIWTQPNGVWIATKKRYGVVSSPGGRAERWLLPPLCDQTPDSPSLTEAATRNIAAIAALERAALNERSRLDRVIDAVISAAGSASFLVVHAGWFGVWITVN